MSIKPFYELYELDIREKISKKPVFRYDKDKGKTVATGQELDYLSWPDCLVLLYASCGAELVQYGNCLNADGHSLFLTCGGNLPEVRVWVDVDGDRRELTYPVIDGTKDISMDKIVQSDVHNATQRAFVKCVAVNWGLGLSLWQKEEKQKPQKPVDDLSVHNIYAIKTRIEQYVTAKLQGGMSMPDIYATMELNERFYNKYLSYFDKIAEFERRIARL